MGILESFTAGWRRVGRFPSVVFWLYFASLLLALPLGGAMRTLLREAIGPSLVHESLEQGFDLAWYGEFAAERKGLAETFGPAVVGILPVLNHLDRLLDGRLFEMQDLVFAAGLLFLLAWAFLAGGILDRYAWPDELHSRERFFSAGGEYFFRFVRLLAISVFLYWLIFRRVVNPLHRWVEEATRDVTVERTALLYALGVYAVAGFLLLLTSLSLDYAKIALVVERRRSAVLAFVRGLRFVLGRPGKTFGLGLLLLGVGLLVVGVYSLVAPGPGQARPATIWLAFLVGQLYLVARLVVKLWWLGSETVLFQSAQAAEVPAERAM